MRVPGLAAAAVLLMLARPAAVEADPPSLPAVTTSCVGASPVSYGGVPWAIGRTAPYSTWSLTTGAGVTVAVLDTGVSAGARGLDGAVLAGVDVVGGGPAATDCYGRGTALAAIVAGRSVPNSGVVGMAPGASILPVRIVDGAGRVPVAALAAGIRAATAAGAGVILVGTGTVDGADLRAAVAEAVTAGIVVVAPVDDATSGVAGAPPAPWFPAQYPQVLAVGGVDLRGGPVPSIVDGTRVDLRAPAAGAVAPAPVGAGHYSVGGTAVAAAFVAGTAALVRSYHPGLGEAAVRARITQTAPFVVALGVGVVDPYAALATVDPARAHQPVTVAADPVQPATAVVPDPSVARAWPVAAGFGAAAGGAATVIWLVRVRRRRPTVGAAG